jgi:hypothetical protein
MQIGPGSQFIARAAIMAVLLTGLSVSSGEGIHLFPFPTGEITGNIQLLSDTTERVPYHENALRLVKAQDKGQTRTTRDHQHAGGSLPGSANLDPRLLAVKGGPELSIISRLFHSRRFTFRLRGRAPPVS